MSRLLPIVALAACGLDQDAAGVLQDAPDESLVDDALSLSQPQPLVELALSPQSFVPLGSECPIIEREIVWTGGIAHDPDASVDGVRETWTGGCVQPDGTAVEGALERFSGPSGAWVAGDGFTVRREGELTFLLDGAVELDLEGDLVFLDASARLCAEGAYDCSDAQGAEGPVSLDLAFSLYPFAGYPDAYDVVVSGIVASAADAPIEVEGAWSTDIAACAGEPASGTFSLRRGERHSLEMDGAATCDGCAAWVFQGSEVEQYCGLQQ